MRQSPSGGLTATVDTTLLGESRLVDLAGKPLAGQVPAPWTQLLDANGRPLPFAPRTGPVVLDLQAGTPAYGSALAQRVPGAQVLGAEGGNWLLAYQKAYPRVPTDLEIASEIIRSSPKPMKLEQALQIARTSPKPADLDLALQIARNSPQWPNTPAFRTSIEGMPRALPWEMDPAGHLFPQQGPMTMLADPLNPKLGAQFFPATGPNGRMVPLDLADVTGVRPTSPLPLPGKVDQILLRRPFGLGKADEATSAMLGEHVSGMLKPGGFVELRPTRATDIGPAQIAAIEKAMPGSVTVRVSKGSVAAFKKTGRFPEGSSAIQQEMIREAASDMSGLGAGEFSYSVRIYSPTASAP